MRSLWNKFKPYILLLIPFIIFGVAIGIYPGYKLYEYVWKNDSFCVVCHVHDYAGPAITRSIHGGLTTCHDCHHQPLREYIRESIVMITKNPKFPVSLHHTPHVPNDLCEACHIAAPRDRSSISGPLEGKDLQNIPRIDRSELHEFHLKQKTTLPLPKETSLEEPEKFGRFDTEPHRVDTGEEGKIRGVACVDCHGALPNRAHNFTPTDASCIRCHKVHSEPSKIQRTFGCRNCHFQQFIVPLQD